MKLFVVDGTGVYSGTQYDELFRGSFCKQVSVGSPTGLTVSYFQGPGAAGISTGTSIGGAAYKALLEAYKADPSEKLYLMGYSRGGAAAIQIAKWCRVYQTGKMITQKATYPKGAKGAVWPEQEYKTPEIKPIPIEAMFLLDPVDKDLSVEGDGIPSNVKRCYVLYRDRGIVEYNARMSPSDYASYTDKTAAVFAMGLNGADLDVFARKWMGNCEVTPSDRNTTTKIYRGYGRANDSGIIDKASHGAAGGVPWTLRYEDKAATDRAATILNHWLDAEGIKKKVKEMYFSQADLGKARSDAQLKEEMRVRAEQEKERIRVRDQFSSKA